LFLTFAGQSPPSRSGSHLLRTHPDTLARAAQFREPASSGYCEPT